MEEIGKILPSIFRKQLLSADARVVEVLSPLWARVVGQGIAENSRPMTFVRGTLTLATSCPTWTAQLRHMAEAIRPEINRYLGCQVVMKLRVEFVPKFDGLEWERAQAGVTTFGNAAADAAGLEAYSLIADAFETVETKPRRTSAGTFKLWR